MQSILETEIIPPLKRSNPFPGLRPFRMEENHLFFGREGQIEEVIKKLIQNKFVAVVGTSGIGKSSFMYCGLLPVLYKNIPTEYSSQWEIFTIRPGITPLRNLAKVFSKNETSNSDEANELYENTSYLVLTENSMGMIDLLKNKQMEAPVNYLLFIDQFEELFRFRQNDEKAQEEATAFIKLISNAIAQKEIPVYILITMRSDFIGDCSMYPALTSLINSSQFLIPQMTRQEKRTAILGPISVMNGRIDEHLVQQILNEVGDNHDALPIMQHALMRTWDYWQQNTDRMDSIMLTHYKAIGGMKNALSVHANEAYSELDERQKEICEKIFKTITEKGEEGRDVRRPTRLGEIALIAHAEPEEVIQVIDYFRHPERTLLMPPYTIKLNENSVIDISHESLMRIWIMLSKWVDEEAESVKLYLRLSEASELHQLGKSGLWRPPDLQIALAWQEDQKPSKEWGILYHPAYERSMLFLDFSKKEYEKEQLNKEKQQRKKILFMRIFTLICLLGIIVAGLLVLYGEQQRQKADKQSQLAKQQSNLAKEQAKKAKEESKKARISAQKAMEQEKIAKEQAENAMISEKRANEQKRVAELATLDAKRQQKLAKNALILAKTEEQKAYNMRLLSISKSMAVKSITLTDPTQKALIAQQAYTFNKNNGGQEHDPDIYDAMYNAVKKLKEESFNSLREHKQNVRALISMHKANFLYSAGSDGKIIKWSPHLNKDNFTILCESPLTVHKALALSSDEKMLVSGGDYSHLQVFDLSRPGSKPKILKGNVSETWFLSFTFDNKGIISGGTEKKIFYWNDQTSRELYHSESKINTIAAHPEQNRIAVGNEKGQLLLLDSDHPDKTEILFEDPSGIPIVSIAYNRNGNLLAVGNEKGIVRLWDMTSKILTTTLTGHTARVNNIRFSNDGEKLATGSFDKTVRIWNMLNIYDPPIVLKDHDDWVWSIEFSPDGDKLLAGCKDNLIRVWPTNVNILADVICGKINRNMNRKEWNQFVAEDIAYEKTCGAFGTGEGIKETIKE